jgi:hypothetical protein
VSDQADQQHDEGGEQHGDGRNCKVVMNINDDLPTPAVD